MKDRQKNSVIYKTCPENPAAENTGTDKEKRAFLKGKRRKSRGAGEKANALTVFMFVILAIYSAILLGLLFWAFITSFKDYRFDYRRHPLGFPKEWVWHYGPLVKEFSFRTDPSRTLQEAKQVKMGGLFLNSGLYAVGCAFFNTLVPYVTAYLCARYRYRFSKIVYTTVIVVMVLPIVGSLPAEIRVARALNLYNHIYGMWVMKANFLGMYFLVFYAAFKSQPMAFTEAAKIDGAGNMTIMLRIVFPLVKTTFATVMIITFIGFWNDYQTPLIYLPSFPTVSYTVYQKAAMTVSPFVMPERMAITMLMLIPTLAVFLIFHRRLFGNLTVGGIKG